jgi:hypothetical protein
MSPPTERLSIREFARRAECDKKQIQRAIEKGSLTRDAEGLLDAAQLALEWRKTNRRGRDAAARKSGDKKKSGKSVPTTPKGAKDLSSPEFAAREDETPEEAAERIVLTAAPFDRYEAERIKENFLALLKKLEYEQKEGSLVSIATAERVLFEGARAQRDAWLNWPARIGPLVAADLGLEADRVTEILTEHVHKHVTQLGEPRPDFAEAG